MYIPEMIGYVLAGTQFLKTALGKAPFNLKIEKTAAVVASKLTLLQAWSLNRTTLFLWQEPSHRQNISPVHEGSWGGRNGARHLPPVELGGFHFRTYSRLNSTRLNSTRCETAAAGN